MDVSSEVHQLMDLEMEEEPNLGRNPGAKNRAGGRGFVPRGGAAYGYWVLGCLLLAFCRPTLASGRRFPGPLTCSATVDDSAATHSDTHHRGT